MSGGPRFIHLMDVSTQTRICSDALTDPKTLTRWVPAVTCPKCLKLIELGRLW